MNWSDIPLILHCGVDFVQYSSEQFKNQAFICEVAGLNHAIVVNSWVKKVEEKQVLMF